MWFLKGIYIKKVFKFKIKGGIIWLEYNSIGKVIMWVEVVYLNIWYYLIIILYCFCSGFFFGFYINIVLDFGVYRI